MIEAKGSLRVLYGKWQIKIMVAVIDSKEQQSVTAPHCGHITQWSKNRRYYMFDEYN